MIQQYLIGQKINHFEYSLLLLFAVLGLLLICSSNDLITAYLAIELQSLAFYVIAAFKKDSTFSVDVGLKYFILGAFSSSLFLFGPSAVYGISGTVNLEDFKDLFFLIFLSLQIMRFKRAQSAYLVISILFLGLLQSKISIAGCNGIIDNMDALLSAIDIHNSENMDWITIHSVGHTGVELSQASADIGEAVFITSEQRALVLELMRRVYHAVPRRIANGRFVAVRPGYDNQESMLLELDNGPDNPWWTEDQLRRLNLYLEQTSAILDDRDRGTMGTVAEVLSSVQNDFARSIELFENEQYSLAEDACFDGLDQLPWLRYQTYVMGYGGMGLFRDGANIAETIYHEHLVDISPIENEG